MRPVVYFVAPAWRRFAVGRLCFAQWAHLFAELAARGLDAQAVVIANDANLDTAREHGFDTLELDNSALGGRFNAGFQHAGLAGADWIVYTGSDNWLHPDLFGPLLELEVRGLLVGRHIGFVHLQRGMLLRCYVPGEMGVIPWLIPAEALQSCGWAPMERRKRFGLDWNLWWSLRQAARPPVLFHDPHALARVDFKSDVGITPYAAITHLGGSEVEPWGPLAELYPAELVELARATHEEAAAAAREEDAA